MTNRQKKFIYSKSELITMNKKGVSPFLAAIMLVLMSIVIAGIVSNFVNTVSTQRAGTIKNITESKLSCQDVSLYIRDVTFDCSGNCFTGAPYNINATLVNSGSRG